VSVILLLVGVVPVLGRIMRFGSVLRLPARKTLDMCWWEGVWCVFGALLWDALWAECVGEVGGVSWLKLLFLFARGDGGGVTFFTGKNR
jgi:hypothetical protein